MMRFVTASVPTPIFRLFSSSPYIDISHLTEENIGITSLTINSPHLLNSLLSSLCSHITECARNWMIQCILLNNISNKTSIPTKNSIQTDLILAKASIRELENRSIPIVTCFGGKISSLLFEVAMSGDIRLLHESAWIEPMLSICLLASTTGAMESLHQRDPRSDRRSCAYKLLKNNVHFGAREAIKVGIGDVCIPMHEDCYQAGLEMCRGIVAREAPITVE